MLSNETTRLSSSKWLNEMRLSYKYIIGTTIITLRKKGISVKHVKYFLCWRCLLLYVYLLTNISHKTTSLYIIRTSSSRVVFIYTTRRQSSFEEHVYTVRTTFVSLYSYANKKKIVRTVVCFVISSVGDCHWWWNEFPLVRRIMCFILQISCRGSNYYSNKNTCGCMWNRCYL